jgi:NTE family protein
MPAKGDVMTKKIVLLLQGGGALGAFQCGAWTQLFPFIRDNEYELIAVVGASIGAINAALIARHGSDTDGGSGVLQDFWRNRIAMPPAQFIPLPGEYWRAWNGLLTGQLLGNRGLFRPAYRHWNPVGDMFRFHMPLYETRNAERTMASVFGEYRGTAPLLAVGTTDVLTGEAVLFDSASRTIEPRMLAASMAIPILFSPVEIDGRYYWDGEIRSNTLLPNLYSMLEETLPRSPAPDDFLVIVMDMFKSDTDRAPASAIESQYRLLNILLGSKLKYDQREFEAGNALLDAMERLRMLAGAESDSALSAAVEEEYRKALAARYARVEFLHIGRCQFEYEYISRDFDYSPQYIEKLIAQGAASATEAIEAYRERSGKWQQQQIRDRTRVDSI